MAVEKELLQAVEKMKEGKEEGFNILYSSTYNYVYSRARYYMNNNEEDALDLTQETYVQAYKGIHNLQDANNIYAWLGSITYRQSMKMHNKHKDVLVSEDAEGIFEDVECTSKDFKPEETAEEKAVVDVIKGMLEELPDLQKKAILAFYYDHMKIEEIAELFDCSPNTIKSRLNYAKQYLKESVLAHEKKYAYRLHSVTPAVIYFAFKGLFAEKEYVLAAEKAQGLYDGVCGAVGITPTAVVSTSASATTSSVTTAAVTNASVKAGLGLGAKIAIGVAAAATVATVTIGGLAASGNLELPFTNQGVISTEDSAENDDATESNKSTKKYLIKQRAYSIASGSFYDAQVIDYEFDDEGRMTKAYPSAHNDQAWIEYKYEDTEDGYVARGYINGQILYSTAYFDKNDVCYRSEQSVESGSPSIMEYNKNGERTLYVQYETDGTTEKSRQEDEYDEYGNIVRSFRANMTFPEGSEYKYVYEYDEKGRPLKRTDQDGVVTLYKYDDANRTVYFGDSTFAVTNEERYDEYGNVIYRNQMGYIQTYKYDEQGNCLEYKMEKDGVVQVHWYNTYATVEEILANKSLKRKLPDDRAWIDEIRNLFNSNDMESIKQFLVSDDFAKKVEPYYVNTKEAYEGAKADHYVLVCSDGTFIGLSQIVGSEGFYYRKIFYSTNMSHDYGFTYLGLGDKCLEVNQKPDGTHMWVWFDGRYVKQSDVEGVVDSNEQYEQYGVDQYSIGFEHTILREIYQVIDHWIY